MVEELCKHHHHEHRIQIKLHTHTHLIVDEERENEDPNGECMQIEVYTLFFSALEERAITFYFS